MKKTAILLLGIGICLTGNNSYGQVPDLKKDFLRNYEAPEFSVSALRVDARFDGWGVQQDDDENLRISNNLGLQYTFYKNAENYQGRVRGELDNYNTYRKSSGSPESRFESALDLFARTNNYFFLNKNLYVGAHAEVQDRYYFDNVDGSVNESNVFVFNPAAGIGLGRIEPVQYARSAMDMEKLLNRSNVLSRGYTREELTTIADRLAEINNVRFYDFRLRRLEQFELLDETMQGIGNITEADARYFASMADSYLYAKVFTRSSGIRNELGLTGGLTSGLYGENFAVSQTVTRLLGYYKFDWFIPQSYAVQHNINFLALAGTRTVKTTGAVKSSPIHVHGGYELSLYPTTRTNFRFGVFGMYGGDQLEGGAVTLNTSAYIYFTPRLRASYYVNYVIGNANNEITDIRHLYPSAPNLYGGEGSRFNFNAGISYAIF